MLIGIPKQPSSGPTGKSLYTTPQAAANCQTFEYDVAAYWDEFYRGDAEALVAASRGSLKVVPGIYPGNAQPHVTDFYGMLSDSSVTAITTNYQHDEGRQRAASPMKTYRQAQRDGTILFHPMRAYKAELEASPRPVGATLISQNTYAMSFPPELPIQATGCWYHSPQRYDQKSGRFLWVQPSSSIKYDWYTASGYESVNTETLRGVAIALGVLADQQVVDTQLVTECRARSNEGLLDLYTTLAESPETVKMLYGILKVAITGYRRTAKEVANAVKRDPRRSADIAAGLWLQWRYGVMPLYYDVRGLLEYLGISKSEFMTVRSKADSSFTLDLIGYQPVDVPLELRCTIKNRLDLSSTKMDQFMRQNLTVTAWELVPLSFIVDWFVTIGDYLASLRAPQASVQEAAMFSWRARAPFKLATKDGLGSIMVQPDYYRALPIKPSDHIGLTLTFGMNFQRTLDALALSWTMFLRGNRR